VVRVAAAVAVEVVEVEAVARGEAPAAGWAVEVVARGEAPAAGSAGAGVGQAEAPAEV
jgi:hypothetical protein